MCARRSPISEAQRVNPASTEAVRPLAPEEIHVGDYVVVLRETAELPAVLWLCDALPGEGDSVLRIPFLPEGGGIPRRVDAVYLPYALVKPPRGSPETLDVRRHQLARVDRRSARTVWRALKNARKKSK